MEFNVLETKLQQHFKEMTADQINLFTVNLDKDTLWNLYLDSFPEGTNNIFRQRREYDCSCCHHFVRNMGNVVAIKEGNVISIWDFDMSGTIFDPVVKALSAYVHSFPVSDYFIIKEKSIGIKSNHEKLEDGTILTWEHFYLDIPENLRYKGHDSIESVMGKKRDVRNVFKRSLDEISRNAIDTMLELTAQKSLYKGDEYKGMVEGFKTFKTEYDALTNENVKEVYAWEKVNQAGEVVGKIRNHAIGTLLIDISEGMDLDTAVRKYEKVVAPENYKRSKPIFSEKQKKEAQDFLTERGYMPSLQRRFARLDDITVNNILFANRDAVGRMAGDTNDIFAKLNANTGISPKSFSKAEEIGIEDFISNVLPTATNVEVLLENKHSQNMVSLITAVEQSAKTMFKWNNNFSWAYTGNITDSSMKENVKKAGGNVNGVLRFSIQWNDGEEWNRNDFDAHCKEPNGNLIYYGNKTNYSTSGKLDVDIINPHKGTPAVENITWSDLGKMPDGVYKFSVECFTNNNGKDGFRAEIEFNGQIYSFAYNQSMRSGQEIAVAEVTLKDGVFTIKEKLPSTTSSKELWGLKTNQFVSVSTIMYSPNYFDEQQGIGHKHVFFMLKDCVNPEQPNGLFNEFLKEELMPYRHVMEALGTATAVQTVDDQLSGIGFSTTKRAEVIVKVTGATERVLKVKF